MSKLCLNNSHNVWQKSFIINFLLILVDDFPLLPISFVCLIWENNNSIMFLKSLNLAFISTIESFPLDICS